LFFAAPPLRVENSNNASPASPSPSRFFTTIPSSLNTSKADFSSSVGVEAVIEEEEIVNVDALVDLVTEAEDAPRLKKDPKLRDVVIPIELEVCDAEEAVATDVKVFSASCKGFVSDVSSAGKTKREDSDGVGLFFTLPAADLDA
jgi:hypothetical protein